MALDEATEKWMGGLVKDADGRVIVVGPEGEPIAGGGGGVGLTDAELRATPVPVSTQDPVSVDDNGSSLTVDGEVSLAAATLTALETTELGATTLSALETIDLGATTLSALENTTVGLGPATSGGLTTFHLVSAATTNLTNVKASAGQVFGWYIYNSNAAARKVAFHNTAGAPTAGSGVVASLVIPPTSAANVEMTNGIVFATGIAISTTTGLADSDTAAVGANDLVINIYYK
jgi:hypothetical protein